MSDTARPVFTTSRLLEFTTVEELTKLVGFGPDRLAGRGSSKRGSTTALDACEDANIAPEITVAISTAKQHHQRHRQRSRHRRRHRRQAARLHEEDLAAAKPTSARPAAHRATRCRPCWRCRSCSTAQRGETTIEAHGIEHHISFSIDPVRREPKIEHVAAAALGTIRHFRSRCTGRIQLAYNWPRRRRELYKSHGLRVAEPARQLHAALGRQDLGQRHGHRSRHGASGGRTIRYRRIGTTARASTG